MKVLILDDAEFRILADFVGDAMANDENTPELVALSGKIETEAAHEYVTRECPFCKRPPGPVLDEPWGPSKHESAKG